MTLPLEKKRALVTGAGVRLGRAIAVALADAGADVAVHHHHSVGGADEVVDEIAAKGRRAISIRADLSEPDGVRALFEELDASFEGKLDVLVNSAGIFEKIPAAEIDLARFEKMMRVNTSAPFLCACAARPRMLAAGGGAIVNITDIAADRPWRGYAHYCASKAALVSLTKSLALEWAPEIRVNAVSPGAVLLPETADDDERSRLATVVPQKRLGKPEDVAATVAFLCGGPSYITGQVIAVDGGRSISTSG